jgi:predicted dehydrogenase
MQTNTRRSFLASTTLAAGAAARVQGANDRIRIGVIGTGGRGRYLMSALTKIGGVEWVAVCDVYDVRRAQAAALGGSQVEQYADYKQLIERKDVDAVIVATPDHWHGRITVDALMAGKDVYVEKPMVHYPADGQAIVKAVRASKRVLTVGTQGRLLPQNVEAKRLVQDGAMGVTGFVRTWYHTNRGYVMKAPAGMEKKPDGLDWERWLGAGPKIDWNPEVYFSPYKWLHYDGGPIMGIGIHVIDDVHSILGLTKPKAAMTSGGIYAFKDRDTPDALCAVLDYGHLTLTFESECLTCPGVQESGGAHLRGTGGTLTVQRYLASLNDTAYEYVPNKGVSKTPAVKGLGTQQSPDNNLRNWLECMRSRQTPVSNVEVAYYSTMACFMANRAYNTKSRVEWDPAWDLPA